jgi:type IV pilus assembly protein PilC
MPEYEYGAVSRDEYKTGVIAAESEIAAETQLVEQGLQVVSLKKRQPAALDFFSQFIEKLSERYEQRMSSSEKILFTTQLASMIKAGLPLVEALSAFIDQAQTKGSSKIITTIIQDLQSGIKFSEALSRQGKVFSATYAAVVRAGENSGTLAESLTYLAFQLKRESELNNRVRSAMIYPTVVIIAMVVVMTFISVAVVPKIATFAESTGQELPVYTLVLVGFVNFVISYWYLIVLVIIMLAIALISFAQSPRGKYLIGGLVLRLPVIGQLAKNINLARFTRALGGFYLYGVNIIASFDILADTLGNPLYQDSCKRIKHRLTMGQTLADSIALEPHLYPRIMVRLIKGAEKTGELGASLEKLATFYEDELDVSLRNVIALIEPALIFVLGFGILGLAMAVIVPIYRVTTSLQ